MKKLLVGLLVSLCFVFTTAPVLAANPFNDAKESDWFYGSVDFAYNHNLFAGTATNKFSPNAPMTRGMFIAVLARLENANVNNYDIQRFEDVDSSHWAYTSINWAYANGLASGIDEGIFGADNTITREQMATFFNRYLNIKGINLTTVSLQYDFRDNHSISNWANSSVNVCQKYGLVTGKPNNIFDPQGNSTRAEVATVFQKLTNAINGNPIILHYSRVPGVPTYDSVTLQFCKYTTELIGDGYHSGFYPDGIEYFYDYNAEYFTQYQNYLIDSDFILTESKYESNADYFEDPSYPGGVYYYFYENDISEFGIWYDTERNLICVSFFS